jgi:hypothetical protein
MCLWPFLLVETVLNGLIMANFKPNKGSFKKGHPGGPGRPKGGYLEWCREYAETEGKEKLLKWANSKNAKASMQALTLIFAYGFGKPTERHEHSGVDALNISDLLLVAEKAAEERGL